MELEEGKVQEKAQEAQCRQKAKEMKGSGMFVRGRHGGDSG